MKMQKLTIKGYRSLRFVFWTPGNLIVFIGPNGSGKSHILRMLEMISVSARGRLGKHIQKAGGMDPLVWDGKTDGIKFTVETSPVETGGSVEKDGLTYKMDIRRLGKSSAYRIEYELLGILYREALKVRKAIKQGRIGKGVSRIKKVSRVEPELIKIIERDPQNASVLWENERTLVNTQEKIIEEESLLSQSSGPFAENRYLTPFQSYLAGWFVYHDLQVKMDAPIRQSTIARHETRVEPDGQNLISVLHTLYTGDRDFKNEINLAMSAAFGDDFEELVFPPAADQRIQLRVRWKTLSREQSAAELSDGTLRFLFS